MERSDHRVDFVQIGNHAIRPENIAFIYFGPELVIGHPRVWIHFAGDTANEELVLSDEAAETFMKWWGGCANVWVIPEKEKAT